jgi:hypothetical protein
MAASSYESLDEALEALAGYDIALKNGNSKAENPLPLLLPPTPACSPYRPAHWTDQQRSIGATAQTNGTQQYCFM